MNRRGVAGEATIGPPLTGAMAGVRAAGVPGKRRWAGAGELGLLGGQASTEPRGIDGPQAVLAGDGDLSTSPGSRYG